MPRKQIGFADVDIDPTPLDDEELSLAIRRCGTLRSRLSAVQAKHVAEIARRKSAAEAEAALKREQGISDRDAKASTKLADTLDKHPELADAVEAGEITPAHARTIGDAEAEHPGASAELLPKAKNQGADQFSRKARDWRHRKDEEAGLDREAIQRKLRKVSLWTRKEDGMGIIHAELDPVSFTKFKTALGAYNERRYRAGADHAGPVLPGKDAPPIEMTPARRLADAFDDIVDAAVSGDDAPSGAQLVVIADYDIASRELINGRFADGTLLAPGVLRRLACDADILPMIFSGASIPLDAGRSRRLPSPTQRLAVIARDRRCRGEGCVVPPEFCKPHHIEWWVEHRGPSDIANLVLVCEACHTGVHNGTLEVVPRCDGSFVVATSERAEALRAADAMSAQRCQRSGPRENREPRENPEPREEHVKGTAAPDSVQKPRSAALFDSCETAEAVNATAARVRSMEWQE